MHSIGMKQDQNWPQYPEQHVGAKPVFNGAPALHKTQLLAQRVEQQDEHHRATNNAQLVAPTIGRAEETVRAILPAEH